MQAHLREFVKRAKRKVGAVYLDHAFTGRMHVRVEMVYRGHTLAVVMPNSPSDSRRGERNAVAALKRQARALDEAAASRGIDTAA